MGNKISIDFFIDYAIYNGYLNDVEFTNPEITRQKIMSDEFCGLHQMEAVIKLIWYKGCYEKFHISHKYALVAKKLEGEVEGGTNKFSDVFREFIKKTIPSVYKDQINEVETTKVAKFLGHLFIVDAIDVNFLGEIIKSGYGNKSLDKAMKVLSDMIQKKLAANNMTFDGISQNKSKDVTKLQ